MTDTQTIINALAMHRDAEGNLDPRTALLRVECIHHKPRWMTEIQHSNKCPGTRPVTAAEAEGRFHALLVAFFKTGYVYVTFMRTNRMKANSSQGANFPTLETYGKPLDALLEAMAQAYGVEAPV